MRGTNMGLDIKTYHYSYAMIHRLRQLALNYEGIKDFYYQNEITTRFKEFIIHSDCDGIYVSKSSKQYEKLKRKTERQYGQLDCYFGDLDKLKEEVQELNEYILKNTEYYVKQAWIDFYNDVMSARKILEFH